MLATRIVVILGFTFPWPTHGTFGGINKDIFDLWKLRHKLFNTVDFAGGIEALYGASGSVIERLQEIKKNLATAGRIDADLSSIADTLGSSTYQIEDLTEDEEAMYEAEMRKAESE